MIEEPQWLLITVVLATQRTLIAEFGGVEGVRDRGLLESSLARPRNLFAYSGGEVSVFDLAASYAYGLAKNHCFVDGNKRIAFTAAMAFLDLHGYRLEASREDSVLTFLHLAEGEISEEELSDWLERHSRGH